MTDTGESRPELTCRREGAVAVLRLERPAARNALGGRLVERLDLAVSRLGADPQVRAIVLAGAPPGFCAGSDLKELARLDPAAIVRHEARTGAVVRRLRELEVPVIAAVEGFAIGGGFLLALCCDLVVSAADARWHLPEVGHGWVPPWGLQALVDRGGPALARRMAWGDRPLTGVEMHRLGLVDELAGPDAAPGRAREYAERLAALPRHAVASTKAALAAASAGAAEALDARSALAFGADLARPPGLGTIAAFARPAARSA